MELKKSEIDFDHRIEKFRTTIAIGLDDGNPMMLKARAELYCNIMDGIGPIVDATIAEFAEKYGKEVIKYAHHNVGEDISPTTTKYVSSREVQKKLLDKIPVDPQ